LRNFSRQAAVDLDHAVGGLLDRGVAPASTEQLVTTVLAAAERLAERPALCRRRPDLLPEPFRFWSIPRWKLLLVYDPATTPATILRVLNTAQDLSDLRDAPGGPEN
jgi:plasmid stabilization system protein ParE